MGLQERIAGTAVVTTVSGDVFYYSKKENEKEVLNLLDSLVKKEVQWLICGTHNNHEIAVKVDNISSIWFTE